MRFAAIPLIALGVAATLLGSCAMGPEPEAKLTPKQQKELAKLLDGKVAGEPVSCVSNFSTASNLRALSDDVLVMQVNRKLVYKNELRGTCTGLSRGDILVMTSWSGGQYCQGDMARAFDPYSGITSGVCSLGKFVPYRTPN